MSQKAAAKVVNRILSEWGRLDILVSNAGGGLRPPGQPSEEEYFRLSRQKRQRKSGYTLCLSSTIVDTTEPN